MEFTAAGTLRSKSHVQNEAPGNSLVAPLDPKAKHAQTESPSTIDYGRP